MQNYPSGIAIYNGWHSSVVLYLYRVIEAGIWTQTEKHELRKNNENRTAQIRQYKSKVFKLTNIATLQGSFSTVFILVGILITLSIFVFIIECRQRIAQIISEVCQLYLPSPYRKKSKMAAKNVIGIAVFVADIKDYDG